MKLKDQTRHHWHAIQRASLLTLCLGAGWLGTGVQAYGQPQRGADAQRAAEPWVMPSPLKASNGPQSFNDSIDVAAVRLRTDVALVQTMRGRSDIVLTEFVLAPLAAGTPSVSVNLELTPISVFGPDTEFVIANPNARQPHQALPLPDVQLFGGRVEGWPDSQVFLSLSPQTTYGFVQFGEQTQVISSGFAGDLNETYVFNPQSLPQGVIEWSDFVCQSLGPEGVAPVPANPVASPGCREVLLAIETDYEFTANLFGGNTSTASAYVATLIGASSQIFNAAAGVRFRLGQVRLWTSASDPWTAANTLEQLYQFREVWSANMTAVPRHLAHFLSGRPLGGGVAWLSVVCYPEYGYGLSANLSGYFPNPIQNSHSQNWDLMVVTHEIGHNLGAIHTHEYCPPVDQCASPAYWGECQTATQCSNSGTIMSYCHTCSGGMSNMIMEFHPASIASMLGFLDSLACNLACTNTAPMVSISSPPNGASYAAGAPILFSGSAADAENGNLSSSLVWLSSLQGTIGSGAAFTRSDLTAGTHVITARCTDSGGLTGQASRTIIVLSSPVNSAPSVSITSPANGSSFHAGVPITFSGVAMDQQDGNLSSMIAWTSNIQGALGAGASIIRSNLGLGVHTITARVTDSGGLQGSASISVSILAAPASPDRVAAADIPIAGAVSGAYVLTHTNNSVSQAVKERSTTGKPGNRYSYLEHRWLFNLAGAQGSTRTFFVNAFRSNSTDGDDFRFEYSINNSSWTPMLTVTKTADDGAYQSFAFPGSLAGAVYVRVRDTDRTPGHKALDSVFIDHMYIRVQ